MSSQKISAIVLAGGASERFGKNKLLMPFKGETILAACISAFRNGGILDVMVITGRYHDEIVSTLGKEFVRFIYNSEYGLGMSSSICTGIRSLDEKTEAVFVSPGDMPSIQPETIRQMVSCFQAGSALIPRFKMKKGHPVLLDVDIARKCLNSTSDRVLYDVLENSECQWFDTADEGIIFDVDNEEVYRRLVLPKN